MIVLEVPGNAARQIVDRFPRILGFDFDRLVGAAMRATNPEPKRVFDDDNHFRVLSIERCELSFLTPLYRVSWLGRLTDQLFDPLVDHHLGGSHVGGRADHVERPADSHDDRAVDVRDAVASIAGPPVGRLGFRFVENEHGKQSFRVLGV